MCRGLEFTLRIGRMRSHAACSFIMFRNSPRESGYVPSES